MRFLIFVTEIIHTGIATKIMPITRKILNKQGISLIQETQNISYPVIEIFIFTKK